MTDFMTDKLIGGLRGRGLRRALPPRVQRHVSNAHLSTYRYRVKCFDQNYISTDRVRMFLWVQQFRRWGNVRFGEGWDTP